MSTFLDLFGFLSVVAAGLDLVAHSALIGSVAFLLVLALPLDMPDAAAFRVLRGSALGAVFTASAVAAIGAGALTGSIGISWKEAMGAGFVIAALCKIAAATGTLAIAVWRPRMTPWVRCLLALFAVLALGGLLATSHAAARPDDRGTVLLATALHTAGAALWLGGLPCFWALLKRERDAGRRFLAGRRYSAIAASGVCLIIAGAVVMTLSYIGSPHALYGTAYGAMVLGKISLFAVLLLLGLGNFLAVRRFYRDDDATRRVRRFVEVEMGIGAAALMLAASITSVPPAVDTAERITLGELAQRMAPKAPALKSPDRASLAIPALQAQLDREARELRESNRPQAYIPGSGEPPPRNAGDIAWSEYNHHWAGIVVLLIGIAAMLNRTGRVPMTKHWPLLFLVLAAFLFFRSDPEVWPTGSIGFFDSLKDPEVLQHRIFVVITIAFALFEWGVRTGRIASSRLALVFPLLTAAGGTFLLTHSHAIANVKEQLLIEYSHLPMAIFGILAGWTRWLEVKAPQAEGRWAGWIWPVCFILIGLLLIDYRET